VFASLVKKKENRARETKSQIEVKSFMKSFTIDTNKAAGKGKTNFGDTENLGKSVPHKSWPN